MSSEMFPGEGDPAGLGTSPENYWEPAIDDQPGLVTLEAPMIRTMLCMHIDNAPSVKEIENNPDIYILKLHLSIITY